MPGPSLMSFAFATRSQTNRSFHSWWYSWHEESGKQNNLPLDCVSAHQYCTSFDYNKNKKSKAWEAETDVPERRLLLKAERQFSLPENVFSNLGAPGYKSMKKHPPKELQNRKHRRPAHQGNIYEYWWLGSSFLRKKAVRSRRSTAAIEIVTTDAKEVFDGINW